MRPNILALAAREVKGAGFASVFGRDPRRALFITFFYIFNVNFFGVLTKAWQFRACTGFQYRINYVLLILYRSPVDQPSDRRHRRYVITLLAWNDRLSVNIAEIDSQHKKLVDMVNELHDAMKAGKAETVMVHIVKEMKQYAASHFGLEERYMKSNNYPDYKPHKTEHDKFVAKVVQVEQDCKAGKCAMSMDILNFLSNWLVNHIKGTDKKYAPFLNNCGIH